jgi:7,8-dihydroneopterin aldolase/epimerase/oxygenase
MAIISLENMRFRAFHGLYEEERIIGNNFILEVVIDADTYGAKVVKEHDTEKVVNTVNYASVYDVCRIEMAKPQLLLETVIQKIFYRLKYNFPNLNSVQIKLSKLNPPLGGIVDSVSITDSISLENSCGKCKSPIPCYRDDTCWCKKEGLRDRIHPRSFQLVAQQYGGCLCARCIKNLEG